MDRKVKCLRFGALLVLLVSCIHLHLLSGNAARPLEVTNPSSIPRTALWTMKHSGPSPGGKGHKSIPRTEDARFLRKLQDSGPSPGIGH